MYKYSALVDFRPYDSDRSYDSAVIGGGDTIEKAMESMIHDIEYYQVECNYMITHTELKAHCATCSGNGEVFQPHKRQPKRAFSWSQPRGKNIRCPDCKGKDSEYTIEEWFNPDRPKR